MEPYTMIAIAFGAFFLVFGGLYLCANHDEKRKVNYQKWLESNNYHLVRSFQCYNAFVGISADALFIDESFYTFQNMAGCVLLSRNETSTTGGASGAIVGGIIGGPVGAIVGSSVSKRTTVSDDSAYGVRVRFRDPALPSLSITNMPPKSAVALFEALITAIENVEKQELRKMIAGSNQSEAIALDAGPQAEPREQPALPLSTSPSAENVASATSQSASFRHPASSSSEDTQAARDRTIWRYCQSGWEYYDQREGRDTGNEFTETIFQHASRRFHMPVENVWAAYERHQARVENASVPAPEASYKSGDKPKLDMKEAGDSAPEAVSESPQKKEKGINPWTFVAMTVLVCGLLLGGVYLFRDRPKNTEKEAVSASLRTEAQAPSQTVSPSPVVTTSEEEGFSSSDSASSARTSYSLKSVLNAVAVSQVNVLNESFDASFWSTDSSVFISVYLPIQKNDVRLALLTDSGQSQFDDISSVMTNLAKTAWDSIVSYGYASEAVYSFDVLDEDGDTLLCFYNDECYYDVSKET